MTFRSARGDTPGKESFLNTIRYLDTDSSRAVRRNFLTCFYLFKGTTAQGLRLQGYSVRYSAPSRHLSGVVFTVPLQIGAVLQCKPNAVHDNQNAEALLFDAKTRGRKSFDAVPLIPVLVDPDPQRSEK
jgi:hypothetical protein